MDQVVAATEDQRTRTITVLGLSVLTGLILALLASWLVTNSIRGPLHNLIRGFMDLAKSSGGTASKRLDDRGSDEMAEVARWFNRFADDVCSAADFWRYMGDFTHGAFHPRNLLRTKLFTHETFYARNFLPTKPFTHET